MPLGNFGVETPTGEFMFVKEAGDVIVERAMGKVFKDNAGEIAVR